MDLDLKIQLFPLVVNIIRKLRDELKKYSVQLKLFHIFHSKFIKMHVFKNSVLVVIIFTQVSKIILLSSWLRERSSSYQE